MPTECVALMVAWLPVRVYILRQFDLELTENAQINVDLFLQKKRHNRGSEGNPLGVLCMVIAYSLPFTKWLHGVFIDFDGTVRRLLWGAIITVAGSGLIKLLLGLVLKFIALVMILLTVKLNTAFLRLPRWFLTERRDQSVTTALDDSPDERVRRLYCTIFVSRC